MMSSENPGDDVDVACNECDDDVAHFVECACCCKSMLILLFKFILIKYIILMSWNK